MDTLTSLWATPDPLTLQEQARALPRDVVRPAADELEGTSEIQRGIVSDRLLSR